MSLSEEEYEVEEFIAKRFRGSEVEYLVKWKGYDSSFNTWELKENLIECGIKIREYEEALEEIQAEMDENNPGTSVDTVNKLRKSSPVSIVPDKREKLSVMNQRLDLKEAIEACRPVSIIMPAWEKERRMAAKELLYEDEKKIIGDDGISTNATTSKTCSIVRPMMSNPATVENISISRGKKAKPSMIKEQFDLKAAIEACSPVEMVLSYAEGAQRAADQEQELLGDDGEKILKNKIKAPFYELFDKDKY